MPERHPAIPSKAALKGHPLHPMLVPFPITFLVTAFLSDLAFWASGNTFWAQVSYWAIGAGLLTGLLAAAAGLTDYLARKPIRQLPAAWGHLMGNGAVLLLTFVNFAVRYRDPAEAVLPMGLSMSTTIVAFLAVTGWLGGELVYRHRVGVMEAEEAPANTTGERDSVLQMPPRPERPPPPRDITRH